MSSHSGTAATILKNERSAFQQLFDSHIRYAAIDRDQHASVDRTGAKETDTNRFAPSIDEGPPDVQRSREMITLNEGRPNVGGQSLFERHVGSSMLSNNIVSKSALAAASFSDEIETPRTAVTPRQTMSSALFSSAFVDKDGVQVLMRDPENEPDAAADLVASLKKILQRVGLGLVRLTINGNRTI